MSFSRYRMMISISKLNTQGIKDYKLIPYHKKMQDWKFMVHTKLFHRRHELDVAPDRVKVVKGMISAPITDPIADEPDLISKPISGTKYEANECAHCDAVTEIMDDIKSLAIINIKVDHDDDEPPPISRALPFFKRPKREPVRVVPDNFDLDDMQNFWEHWTAFHDYLNHRHEAPITVRALKQCMHRQLFGRAFEGQLFIDREEGFERLKI
jgi:thiol-disulfide isomerase/thioredoxin